MIHGLGCYFKRMERKTQEIIRTEAVGGQSGTPVPTKARFPDPPITNYELQIPNYFKGFGTTCTFRTSVVPLSPVPPAVTTTRSPALT